MVPCTKCQVEGSEWRVIDEDGSIWNAEVIVELMKAILNTPPPEVNEF